jgi:hypothetical protein
MAEDKVTDPVAYLMDNFGYSEHEAKFILSIERGTLRGDVRMPVMDATD